MWADDHDIMLRRKTVVTVHPVMAEADRWQARLEQLIGKPDAEQRERERVRPLTLAELEAEIASE